MKRSSLRSLDDLRAFETVARLGSVRAAAIELSLTHGAVSRRVANLSRDLGLELLEPHGRGVRLTKSGRILAEATSQGLGLIGEALRLLRAGGRTEQIVLSCERTLAMRWLIPRLSSFSDEYPNIDIQLSTGGGSLNFQTDGVAMAIRRLDFPVSLAVWSIEHLMPETVGPVMTVALRERFERGDYTALGSRTRPEAWDVWLKSHPEVPRPRTHRLLDHHFLVVEASLSGLGVGLVSQAVVKDDVAAGRLQAPLGFEPDGTDYGLIYPKTMQMTDELQALRDWLMREFEMA
jgi:DNA-binding transcriptional LysR family regulator